MRTVAPQKFSVIALKISSGSINSLRVVMVGELCVKRFVRLRFDDLGEERIQQIEVSCLLRNVVYRRRVFHLCLEWDITSLS